MSWDTYVMGHIEGQLHFPPLPKATTPLWAGVLGAPAAWFLQFQLIYMLVHKACSHQHRVLLTALSAALLITCLICGAICLHYHKRWQEFGEQSNRVRFLAMLGAVSGLYYGIVIIAQGIATIMLDPCAT